MAPPLKKRLINPIILLVFSFLFLVSAAYAQQPKYIRVAIMQNVDSLSLRVNDFYEIVDSGRQKILYRGRNLKTTVTTYRDGILIGNISPRSDNVLVRAGDTEAIVINGRNFRGDIQFIKKDNAHLSVINYIELEDYIKGILYHEASHYWSIEALKAQAIACRTYAAYQMQENSLKDYDVTSDIYSQVYGGKTSERYRTTEAVRQTKGYVLTYQDKLFPAYYHATCAGHTEDASRLWDINLVPLKGVACGFCQESPHFNWHYVLSTKEVEEKLNTAGYKISNIEDIIALERNNSGRIIDLKIIFSKKELKVSAKDFRNIIGPNIIRSTNFRVGVIGDDIVLEGFGWGHGVGLCQWGAYFMAKQGYDYKRILKYYYPGSDITILK